MIRFRCLQCSRLMAAPAEFAGKVIRCRGCKKALRVPQPAPETIPTPEQTPVLKFDGPPSQPPPVIDPTLYPTTQTSGWASEPLFFTPAPNLLPDPVPVPRPASVSAPAFVPTSIHSNESFWTEIIELIGLSKAQKLKLKHGEDHVIDQYLLAVVRRRRRLGLPPPSVVDPELGTEICQLIGEANYAQLVARHGEAFVLRQYLKAMDRRRQRLLGHGQPSHRPNWLQVKTAQALDAVKGAIIYLLRLVGKGLRQVPEFLGSLCLMATFTVFNEGCLMLSLCVWSSALGYLWTASWLPCIVGGVLMMLVCLVAQLLVGVGMQQQDARIGVGEGLMLLLSSLFRVVMFLFGVFFLVKGIVLANN